MDFYVAGGALLVGFAAGSFLMAFMSWQASRKTTVAIEKLSEHTNGALETLIEKTEKASEAKGAADERDRGDARAGIARAASDDRAKDVLAVAADALAARESSDTTRTIEETVVRHVEEKDAGGKDEPNG